MAVLLLVLAAVGPAEALAGKFPRHTDEYRARYDLPRAPRPDPLPDDTAALTALVAEGHDAPELFAALGRALERDGRERLAYRAFRRAQERAHADGRDDVALAMQRAAARLPRVPEAVIEAERREAEVWAAAYRRWERATLARGGDARDPTPFYARWGRPEDDLASIVWATRVAFLGGLLAGAVGLAAAVGALARRLGPGAAYLAIVLGGIALPAPAWLGREGLLVEGGAVALAGGIAAWVIARFRSVRRARTLRA